MNDNIHVVLKPILNATLSLMSKVMFIANGDVCHQNQKYL